MDKSRKMEGDHYRQRRTTWILWKEGVTPSDISSSVICNLWTESTYTQHCVQLGTGRQQWQAAVRVCHHDVPEEWYRETIRSSQGDGSEV